MMRVQGRLIFWFKSIQILTPILHLSHEKGVFSKIKKQQRHFACDLTHLGPLLGILCYWA